MALTAPMLFPEQDSRVFFWNLESEIWNSLLVAAEGCAVHSSASHRLHLPSREMGDLKILGALWNVARLI
jgi:hypothetical protein